MNFYIVMQGRAFEEERKASVICSEIFNKKGEIPHFWGRMQEVVKGDVIFHYDKGAIVAISRATSNCFEAPIPYRPNVPGFVVQTNYIELEQPIHVKANFHDIQPLLPVKYAAFQDNADGNQGYLYPCNEMLAIKLLELTSDLNIYLDIEEQLEFAISAVVIKERNELATLISTAIHETQVKLRRSQHKFKQVLVEKWQDQCAVCGMNVPELLVATYAKPMKDCSHEERINPMNGLLLCANHSALYRNGLISFDGTGKIHISPKLPEEHYDQLFISPKLKVNREQSHKPFYKWHKKYIFKK